MGDGTTTRRATGPDAAVERTREALANGSGLLTEVGVPSSPPRAWQAVTAA